MSVFESQNYLSDYPWLDSEDIPYREPNETWLDSVPKGWQPLFLALCKQIKENLVFYKVPLDKFAFDQVKEKYGELRIYWHIDSRNSKVYENISSLIDQAEIRSKDLCSVCGEPATHMSTGWVRPFCLKCAQAGIAAANARHKTNWTVADSFREIKRKS